mmetsp:Transcript_3117/g.4668  ORF Transcript_3117/g.4668 Transcript_3117/m.4668 type:complete len:208 (+) Transcript_3117:55-678(+)
MVSALLLMAAAALGGAPSLTRHRGLSSIYRLRNSIFMGFSGRKTARGSMESLRGGAEIAAVENRIAEVEEEIARLKQECANVTNRVEKLNAESKLTQKEIEEGNISSMRSFTEAIDARSIFVKNVEKHVQPTMLEDHFASCGTITRVTIPQGVKGPKGFAYIEFVETEAVENALTLNNTLMAGRPLFVVPKRTNKPGIRRRIKGRFT